MAKSLKNAGMRITLPFFAIAIILVFALVFFVVLYSLVAGELSNGIRLVVTVLLIVVTVVASMLGIAFYLIVKKRS